MAFFNPKILGFLYTTKKKTNLGSEMQKVNRQKIVGNLLVKLRKLYIRMEHSPGNF